MKKSLFLILIVLLPGINAQSWKIAGIMPYPVQGGSAVVIDSVIYIIGGYNSQSNSNVDLIQSYDPRTNSWSIADHSINARYGLNAVSINDSIAYLGGINSGNVNSGSLELWNRKDKPFVSDNNVNFKREFAAGVNIDNYFYLFGGSQNPLNFNYWIKYDIAGKTITDSSGYNFSSILLTNQMAAADNNNNIYVFGGLYSVGGNSFLDKAKDIKRFNINSNLFVTVNSKLSIPTVNGAAVYFGNNQIYIIGGFSETQTLSDVEIFNTNSKNITPGPSLNIERKELIAVKYGNTIYVFGGSDKNNQTVQSFEKLDVVTSVENAEDFFPKEFKLFQNYPNPFNPATVIKYTIPKESFVTLKIFNILGEEVATLVNENKSAGSYELSFNSNNNDKIFGSGVYFYRLQAGNFVQTRKMILLK